MIKSRVIALLEKYQLRYSVEWWLSGQPFLTGRGKLVDAVVNAIEHYNEIKPQLLTNGGTSDGRFIARMGAQVVELGPVNATIHKINECVTPPTCSCWRGCINASWNSWSPDELT